VSHLLRLFFGVGICFFMGIFQGCASKPYPIKGLYSLCDKGDPADTTALLVVPKPATNILGNMLYEAYAKQSSSTQGWSETAKELAQMLRNFGNKPVHIHIVSKNFTLVELRNASTILSGTGFYKDNIKVTIYGSDQDIATFKDALRKITLESNLTVTDRSAWPMPEDSSPYSESYSPYVICVQKQ
jgi:hypothetical protein